MLGKPYLSPAGYGTLPSSPRPGSRFPMFPMFPVPEIRPATAMSRLLVVPIPDVPPPALRKPDDVAVIEFPTPGIGSRWDTGTVIAPVPR